MTEIPEHLLKRSRERRGAAGGGGDADGATGASSSAPAKVSTAAPATTTSDPVQRASAPAPAATKPPPPDSAVVAAYKSRRKVPFWAMAALSVLPVWAFLYTKAVTTQVVEAAGPIAVGQEVYSGCQSCHGAAGQGVSGLGYQFSEGEILKSYPHIEDQLRFVYFGTSAYNIAGVQIAGNPDREGGPHIAGARGLMPAQGGNLTDDEILGVVCHERYDLGGADLEGDNADEYEMWCSETSEIFADLEGGGALADLNDRFEGIIPIGDAPAAGSPASG